MTLVQLNLPPDGHPICVTIPPGPHKPLPYVHTIEVTLPSGPWKSLSAKAALSLFEIERAMEALSVDGFTSPKKNRYYFLFDAEHQQGHYLGTQDDPAAAKLARESVYASLGVTQDVHKLGLDYLRGNGVPASRKSGLALFRHAAQKTPPKAALALAQDYWKGEEGLLTTEEEALMYTIVAAEDEKEGAEARTLLQNKFSSEFQTFAPPNIINQYYLTRLEKGKHQARFVLGQELMRETPSKALVLIKEAADSGLASAQWEYSVLLLGGFFPLLRQNSARAHHYRMLAADQGIADAQLITGQLLLKECPPKKDEARHYFVIAAAQGHQKAQHELLLMDVGRLLRFEMR